MCRIINGYPAIVVFFSIQTAEFIEMKEARKKNSFRNHTNLINASLLIFDIHIRIEKKSRAKQLLSKYNYNICLF